MIGRARPVSGAWAAMAVLMMCGACGYIGPPLPPALHLPLRVADLSAVERGSHIIVQFTMPVTTTEGMPIEETPVTEIYVGPSAKVFNTAQWLAGATRFTDTSGKGRVEIPAGPFVGKDIVIALHLKNDRGRDAGWSNFVDLPVTASLSRPEKLEAASDAQGIKLTWTGSAPLYRIYRKDSAAAAFAPLGDTTNPTYIDTTAEYLKPYQYFVQGLQKSGDKTSESDVSDTLAFTAKDTFAPAVPANVRTIVGTRTVELSWDRNTEPDLAAYRLYRAEGDGPFQVVAASLTAPSYSDHDVKPGVRYRYQVMAVDQATNESALSAPVEARLP